MTREEAITVFKAFMDNPLFSDVHKAAFNIAIHDIKQRHDWDINNLILINKDNYESQEPKTGHWIPVSERLPKIAGIYRVTRYYPNNVINPNYLVDACCFDGSNTWHDDNRFNHDRAYANNVIAWQENPEPYKVEPQESEE